MSIAIVYMSKHGTTQKVANILKEKINSVELIDLRKNKKPDI
ncbi:MAG: flavodoxin, partial [Bacteroidetes bacterium]